MISEAEWKRAASALAGATQVAIACHIDPDGDALGSVIALSRFLARNGKKVWTGWGSKEVVVPPQYEFLPGAGALSAPEAFPDSPEVFVAADCGDDGRLDLLKGKFRNAATTINLDHHLSNPRFGDINLVEVGAASSSELVYELIRRMDGVPDTDEATCLYTGIVTDTGRFQHSNTSPATLRAAAALRELGVDHEKVNAEVYESASFSYLHVLGVVLSRARLDDGLVWSWLRQEDLRGLDLDETENLIDSLRAVREGKVAVVLKEQPDRTYKASLRSRGEVDVSKVAQAFGGGGHARAAGFLWHGEIEPAIQSIKSLI